MVRKDRFRMRISRNPGGMKWDFRRTSRHGIYRLHNRRSNRPRKDTVPPPDHRCCFRTRRSHSNRCRDPPTSLRRTVLHCNCRHHTSNNLPGTPAHRPHAHHRPCRRCHLRSGLQWNISQPVRWQPATRRMNRGRKLKAGVRGREKDSFRA